MPDFLPLLPSPPANNLLYTGSYDPVLVGLSVAVAILAAYASLLVSLHVVPLPAGRRRSLWLAAGGLCLGAGIWGMHFVGMLAFSLPCTTGYDGPLTLLSTIPGILASTLALHLISRPGISSRRLVAGGLLIGAGIGAMHYSGMAALRLDGLIRYDLKLFALSILVAVALAILALRLKFRLQAACPGRRQAWVPALSALVLGLAVSAMHYTAMAAAYFIRDGDAPPVDARLGPSFLALLVLVATGVIIVVTIVATCIARPRLFSLHQTGKALVLMIAGWVATAWLGADYYHGRQGQELYREALKEANFQADYVAGNIRSSLQLLKGISLVFARDEDIRRALRRFAAPPAARAPAERRQAWLEDGLLAPLNAYLAVAATHLGADTISVINGAGDCIATSNADQPEGCLGVNFSDRDYFRLAQAGQPARQYAVGRASKVAGLFYSHPVMDHGHFLGTVVVKRNMAGFSAWTGPAGAFISDANGVVILAAAPDLALRTLPQARAAGFGPAQLLAQYARPALEPLALAPWNEGRLPEAVRLGNQALPAALASRPLAEDAITVHVPRFLTGLPRLAEERQWLFLLLAAAGSMLIVAALAVVLYWRAARKAEADLRIAATAFESQEGMVITDARNIILRVNRAFSEMTGYSSEEAVGRHIGILKSGRHDAAFYTAMWEEIGRTGSWQGEVWDRRKTGEIYPKWLTITAVRGEDGEVTHYVGTHTDITQRKAAEDEIRHLAFYDPLTRLPNRRLLLDRLQQAVTACLRSGRQGALLFIDLDNFKILNDTLGHDHGDLLLQQVAQRLAACVRASDTVARLGGDEFVAMLEDLSPDSGEAARQAETVGGKILASLGQPYFLNGHEHHSTPSIGVTLFGACQEGVDELLKRADLAMYQAKAGGRNTLCFFDPPMQAAVSARASLEQDLHEALGKDQFLLHFQVQVDAAGKPAGAEALVRWQHPQRGLVTPGDFMALAEETGLILPLGRHILDLACAQLAAWAADPATAGLTLAVNVSPRQFRQPDFLPQILELLARHGADPRLLKLELTESILLRDVEDTIAKMTALKARGVGFSLDDFGRGYSSLAYLKRLPLDQLKIARAFVRDVLTDLNDAAIIRTILALARSLGLAALAEGVESEAQRDFLADLGCTAYQGFFFGPPLPAEEFALFLQVAGEEGCLPAGPIAAPAPEKAADKQCE